MCGINALFGFSGHGDLAPAISLMNDCIAHRGPDDHGVYAQPGIALGHRRLSIIDLSSAGHQPMHSTFGKQVLVFNGEIYNFKEVKAKLYDYPFRTSTDTEVILAAWKKWGPDCLHHFNGMFAFALWDEEKQELFIVRDRLGIKPVYYSQNKDYILFSSEVRGLLASGMVDRKISADALIEYIRYQTVHAPQTILQDVKMLLPGHYMRVTRKGAETVRWWKPVVDEKIVPDSYKDICSTVKELFSAAVERRLVADVPFGAFLSGGIDSSAVTAVMSQVSGSRIKTFNITFDSSEFSEAVYARQVAEKYNTEHHEIVLTPEHFLEQLPAALNAMDHPSGDGPNTYVVSEATKNAGITMALSGLGGDELFAGYDIFKRAWDLNEKKWIATIPKFARNAGGRLLRSIKPGVASDKIADVLASDSLDFEAVYPKSREVYNADVTSRLTGNSSHWQFPSLETVYGLHGFNPNTHFLSEVSLAEITTYMQNTLLRDTDQMSMAHALEVRVPFLDYELVNFVLNVQDEWKYPSSPKKLLVDSMSDLLPKEIVNRPKMGFTFPWKEWMKKDLRVFCEAQLQYLGTTGILVNAELIQLWERFLQDDRSVTWSRIWHLVVLGHWMKKNGIHG
jgi:asparagine synthase (glutamine-hydrolysing)